MLSETPKAPRLGANGAFLNVVCWPAPDTKEIAPLTAKIQTAYIARRIRLEDTLLRRVAELAFGRRPA